MQKVEMIYDGQQPKKQEKSKKCRYYAAFEITDKTTKAQLPAIEGWNDMRACLIENGLMEPKKEPSGSF